jgi:uncharacterized membrane protein YcaP (DUF421 family)
MWIPQLPWYELIARGAIIYAFLLILLRVTGKRQVGQLAPFDLILLLVLSNSIQNAMNGGDNSILGGMVVALTLIGLNWLVSFATFYNKTLALLIEGKPIRLIHEGVVNEKNLRKAKLTHHELLAALRAEGCGCITKVEHAVLENNGKISVVLKPEHATI